MKDEIRERIAEIQAERLDGEKLDEILLYVHNSGRMADRKLAETKPEDILPWLNVDQAKQAIISIISDQVEEAYKKGYIDGGIAALTQDTKGATQ